MTSDTATRRERGYRRVLRHLIDTDAGVVVPTNHGPKTIAAVPDAQRREMLERRFDDHARHALDIVKACADPATVYDFSSDTTADGDSFVVTLRFTPQRTK